MGFVFALTLTSFAEPAAALDPVQVLFVANGNYSQETLIAQHLEASGAFVVTRIKDYQVKTTTNFAAYDLVILTEFAPNVSSLALGELENLGVPTLIVSYWDCAYAAALGLITGEHCGYVGGTSVELYDNSAEEVPLVGRAPRVYTTSYTLYGADALDLEAGVEPLAYSSRSFNELAMLWVRSARSR